MSTQVYDYKNVITQVHDYKHEYTSTRLQTWVHEYTSTSTQVHKYMSTWVIHEYMSTLVHEYTSTRVREYEYKHVFRHVYNTHDRTNMCFFKNMGNSRIRPVSVFLEYLSNQLKFFRDFWDFVSSYYWEQSTENKLFSKIYTLGCTSKV